MSQTMTAVFRAGHASGRVVTAYPPAFSTRDRNVRLKSASSAPTTFVGSGRNASRPARIAIRITHPVGDKSSTRLRKQLDGGHQEAPLQGSGSVTLAG